MMTGLRNAAFTSAVLLAVGAGVMSTAHAETVSPNGAPTIQIGSTNIGNGPLIANADGSFTLAGTQSGGTPDPTWQLDWNLTIDYDPFINGSLSVTNLSTTARNFTLAIGLPVTAFMPSLYGGSIIATVFDLNGDHSASVSPSTATGAGPGIYQGTVDGSPVLNLFAVTLSCVSGTGGCSATGGDQDGLPGATIPGPGVTGAIGTVLKFSLSAGDKVTFDTNFTVVPVTQVPLPASAWLLLAGLGAIGALTRKRFNLSESFGSRSTLTAA
jgi:hypothetical protein